MSGPVRITVLGCGGSAGVPLIGCDCAVCTSDDPRNHRLRVSLLIQANGKNILVDTSPDLRQQALKFGVTRVDAVVYTHDHADHTHGLDDIRSFNYLSGEPIPVFGDEATLELLKTRFAYAFQPKPENIWFRPCLVPNLMVAGQEIDVEGVKIRTFRQHHGKSDTVGLRIGNFAYSTDTNGFPEESSEFLEGLDLWLVDCLRHSESYSHSNLKLTLSWVERFQPKRTVLTHMAHDFDYDTLLNLLPSGVIPAYDGMELEC